MATTERLLRDESLESNMAYTRDGLDQADLDPPSWEPPVIPRLTLHEFRKFQNSPVIPTSPDGRLKRVRKKLSLARLNLRSAPDFHARPSIAVTSLHGSTGAQASNFYLPPTPTSSPTLLCPSKTVPCLSSTIETLHSTASCAPISPASAHFPSLGVTREPLLASEPLRTKRKFEPISFAKRLPLPRDNKGTDQLQVHAAIIDLTPAETDPLLESFFERRPLTLGENMENLSSEQGGRSRPLYSDFASAYRKITGSPSVPSAEQCLPADAETKGAEEEMGPSLFREASPEAGDDDAASTIHPQSARSDPFDLQVSEDEMLPITGNIDDVLAGGRRRDTVTMSVASKVKAMLGEEGAEAQPSFAETNTTLGSILADYEYTRQPFGDDEGRDASLSPPYAGKGKQPIRDAVPPSRPLPMPSSFLRDLGPNVATNLEEASSSNQTYGSTDELLRLTPKPPDSCSGSSPDAKGPLRVVNRTPTTDDAASRHSVSLRTSMSSESSASDSHDARHIVTQSIFGGDGFCDPLQAHFDKHDVPRARDDCDSSKNPFAGFAGGRTENESGWYTDNSDDSIRVPRLSGESDLGCSVSRRSEESYADTSVYSQDFPLPQISVHRGSVPFRRSIKIDQVLALGSSPEHGCQDLARAISILRRVTRNATCSTGEKVSTAQEMKFLDNLMKTDKATHQKAQSIVLEDQNRLSRDGFEKVLQEAKEDANDDAAQAKEEKNFKSGESSESVEEENPMDRRRSKLQKLFGVTAKPLQQYSPLSSLDKIVRTHREAEAARTHANPAATESRALLIESPQAQPVASVITSNLKFSESSQTFQTAVPERPRTPLNFNKLLATPEPIHCPHEWTQPLRSPSPEEYELQPIQIARARATPTAYDTMQGPTQPVVERVLHARPGLRLDRPAPAAMSSRASTFPLRAESSSTINGRAPTPRRRYGPLTDEELLAAEPGWTDEPNFGPDGPLAHAQTHRTALADMHARQARQATNIAADKKWREQSRIYFWMCVACPVTCWLYGIGKFDGMIEKKSQGQMKRMRPDDKKVALYLALPTVTILYVVIIVTILAGVYGGKGT